MVEIESRGRVGMIAGASSGSRERCDKLENVARLELDSKRRSNSLTTQQGVNPLMLAKSTKVSKVVRTSRGSRGRFEGRGNVSKSARTSSGS